MSITATRLLTKALSPSTKTFDETYVDSSTTNDSSSWTFFDFVIIIIDLAFMALAAWLSWHSNTLIGIWNTPLKVLWAILAFLFGGLYYIFLFLIFRLDVVWYLSRQIKSKK